MAFCIFKVNEIGPTELCSTFICKNNLRNRFYFHLFILNKPYLTCQIQKRKFNCKKHVADVFFRPVLGNVWAET